MQLCKKKCIFGHDWKEANIDKNKAISCSYRA